MNNPSAESTVGVRGLVVGTRVAADLDRVLTKTCWTTCVITISDRC